MLMNIIIDTVIAGDYQRTDKNAVQNKVLWSAFDIISIIIFIQYVPGIAITCEEHSHRN